GACSTTSTPTRTCVRRWLRRSASIRSNGWSTSSRGSCARHSAPKQSDQSDHEDTKARSNHVLGGEYMLNVGFIGLGAMGRPISLHLLRRGYPLGVYARRPAAAEPIVAAGAALYASPAALGEASDVVITMITGTNDVEEVLLG